VDTWWQTETGGILITPLPGAWALKPGSATLPFFGVHPVLLDDKGREIDGSGESFIPFTMLAAQLLAFSRQLHIASDQSI